MSCRSDAAADLIYRFAVPPTTERPGAWQIFGRALTDFWLYQGHYSKECDAGG